MAMQPFLLVWTYVSASSDAVSSPLLPASKAARGKASKTELDLVLNAGRARSLWYDASSRPINPGSIGLT